MSTLSTARCIYCGHSSNSKTSCKNQKPTGENKMFNFNKSQEDPQKALDNARNVVNKGLMGGITKACMGQGFVDKMNAAMDQGQAAMDGVKQMNWVAQNGYDACAEVLSVLDTGATINMNPVVEMKLTVIPT